VRDVAADGVHGLPVLLRPRGDHERRVRAVRVDLGEHLPAPRLGQFVQAVDDRQHVAAPYERAEQGHHGEPPAEDAPHEAIMA
jgi:hypothetical protein